MIGLISWLRVMPRTEEVMNRFFQLLILLTMSTNGLSQTQANSTYGMTSEQNRDWLANLGSAGKDLQLSLVKSRLIENIQTLNQADRLEVPVLVIDGIPIEVNISDGQKEFLKSQLTVDKVEIIVVAKEPEGLYVNKAFTGVVLVTITDKKTSRKFRRLR